MAFSRTLTFLQAKYRSSTSVANADISSEVAEGKELGAEVTISRDEYEALKTNTHELEELANRRVAVAIAQVSLEHSFSSLLLLSCRLFLTLEWFVQRHDEMSQCKHVQSSYS